MKPNLVPFIAKPCPVDWDSMIGDEKRRYCEHCRLHVHNLSAMTTAEQHSVLKPDGTRKCINYIVQPGQVIAPVGQWLNHHRWQALRGKVAALFVASLSLLGVSCQSTQHKPDIDPPDQTLSTPTMTTPEFHQPEEGGKMPRLGGVPPMPDRPWWKRLLGIY